MMMSLATSSALQDDNLAALLQQAVSTTLNGTFQVKTQLDGWRKDHAPITVRPRIACMMQIMQGGTDCGVFITIFDTEVILNVLHAMGVVDTSDHAIIEDAIEEITNMMYGVVKTNLNSNGCHLEIGFSVPVDEDDVVVRSHQHDEKMIVPFLADGHQCHVVFSFQQTAA
jgi:CheY-specific phosphatase CheX